MTKGLEEGCTNHTGFDEFAGKFRNEKEYHQLNICFFKKKVEAECELSYVGTTYTEVSPVGQKYDIKKLMSKIIVSCDKPLQFPFCINHLNLALGLPICHSMTIRAPAVKVDLTYLLIVW